MKLKSALFCLLSLSNLSSFGVMVKMPDAYVLEEKFNQLGLSDFNKKTHLINKLANRKLETVQLIFEFRCALYSFSTCAQDNSFKMYLFKDQTNVLLRSLFKDFPEILQELENPHLEEILTEKFNNLFLHRPIFIIQRISYRLNQLTTFIQMHTQNIE